MKVAAMISTTGPDLDRCRRGGGFTLLELIAVLVLISTVLAIAAPSLRGFVRGRQTADAAAQMLALTHYARSQAAAQGRTYRLNVDIDAGVYWLTAAEGGAFVELRTSYGRSFELPSGVAVIVEADGDDELLSYVQFYPDGRCDAAVIQLEGQQGECYQIVNPSASERFEIVKPEEDERL